jgi:hypothetical protein
MSAKPQDAVQAARSYLIVPGGIAKLSARSSGELWHPKVL